MTPTEAYKILGLEAGVSDDDLKKRFRLLAKAHHPDKHGHDDGKLKEINQAHDLVRDARANPQKYQPKPHGGPWGYSTPWGGGIHGSGIHGSGIHAVNLNDLFATQQVSHSVREAPPIELTVTISFRESVLGADRTITYQRMAKCRDCSGSGSKPISNGCQTCNGFGRVVTQNRNTHFSHSCQKCRGQNVTQQSCGCESGARPDTVEGKISIPPGRQNGEMLRMQGRGNFGGDSMFGEAYSDVMVRVVVTPHEGLTIVGADVCVHATIPLIDALRGCQISVPTIDGPQQITLLPRTANRDEMLLPGMGVNLGQGQRGNQRVVVTVEYPTDTARLIEALEQS